jgi:2-polyprenyl-3-methyl-5-hydroxy-6-metoxy-1,4-benzoquinol methylase
MDRDQFELHAYMEDRHWWFLGRRRILAALCEELLGSSTGAAVVDLGCGTGGNAAALARDHRVVGLDAHPDAISLARERFPAVEFRHGSVFDDTGVEALARADLVVCTDVAEHVEDDVAFVDAIVESLPPGGHLLITVPAHPGMWSPHDVAMGHYRRYTPRTFEQLLSSDRVDLGLFSYYNTRLFPLARVERVLSRVRGKTRGAHQTDLTLPPAPLNRALASIFAGESSRLLGLMRGARRPYPTGLSLIASVRRRRAA